MFAIVSIVIVVFEVAGNTPCFHFVVERTFGMTITASKLAVFAQKIEGRVPRMVKARVVPITWIMAAAALIAAAAVVCVVVSMAVDAVR